MDRIVISIAVALIFGSAVFLLLPNDEEKIERLFEELTALASEPKTGQGIAKIRRIKGFEALFTETVTFGSLDLPVRGDISRKELTQLFFTVVERSQSVTLTYDELTFGEIADGQAEVITRFKGEALLIDGVHYENSATVKVSLSEVDGDWKFRGFEAVQVPRYE